MYLFIYLFIVPVINRVGIFLRHHFEAGSGSLLASNEMGTKGSFLKIKAAGACSWPLTSI